MILLPNVHVLRCKSRPKGCPAAAECGCHANLLARLHASLSGYRNLRHFLQQNRRTSAGEGRLSRVMCAGVVALVLAYQEQDSPRWRAECDAK